MKTISVRDFLRGGYRTISEPVIVMNHSTPIGVWDPTKVTLTATTYLYGTVWNTPTPTGHLRYDDGE